MKSQNLQQKDLRNVTIGLVIVYAAINVFRIGGDTFVSDLNTVLTIIVALTAVIYLWRLLPQLSIDYQNRSLWWGYTIGLSLWALAELIYSINTILKIEISYPSWADAFWMMGYILFYYALLMRILSLPRHLNRLQKTLLWSINLVVIFLTVFFVFIPIIQSSDPNNLAISILDILYPLTNLLLLILVLRIAFDQRGKYKQAWLWISFGHILISESDFMFAYASIQEIYYPDGQANLLSTIGVDVPYNLGYLLLIIGFITLRDLVSEHFENVDTITQLIKIPNTHVLVFIKNDDTVIDVSQNFSSVFHSEAIKEKTISELLGISAEEENNILNEFKRLKILSERPFSINTLRENQQVFISGIVIHSPQKEYSGATLLLRLLTDDYSLDSNLSHNEKAVVQLLLEKTNTGEKREAEIKLLLSAYYSTHLWTLYNRVLQEGGAITGESFLIEIRNFTHNHGIQINLSVGSPIDVASLSVSETQKFLSELLETAKKHITNILNQSIVEEVSKDIDSRFDDATLKNLQYVREIKNQA